MCSEKEINPLQSSVGSTGEGCGGGTPAAAPPSTPRAGNVKDSDRVEEQDKPANSYHCLFISRWRNVPHDIDRHDCDPLPKREYFALRNKWRQLLAGKRTYLLPPRIDSVPSYNYDDFLFQCPEPLMRTLGCQEPISVLVRRYPNNRIILEKIKILCQHYVFLRQTRRDVSSFYRAFLFSYLENLGQMQDRQAEVRRLMECVARSREYFCHLKWDKAYFLYPVAYFSSVLSEFKNLINTVANGLSADKLYERSQEEIMSFRILSFLRLLTEIEIRKREEDYMSFFPQQKRAHEVCLKVVRAMDVEAKRLHIRALSYALGIPFRLELLDASLKDGVVQLKHLDFFPPSESGVSTLSGPLDSQESYHSLSTKSLEQGQDNDTIQQTGVSTTGNLLLSDGTPLVTLLCRPGNYDILYRK